MLFLHGIGKHARRVPAFTSALKRLADHPLQLKKIFLIQDSAVHFPAALHQIMRLINQKKITLRISLSKKTFEIYMWIKHIIIVTDHSIRKQAHIQTHLKRTYPVLFGITLYHFT